jgi:hypothetical protein
LGYSKKGYTDGEIGRTWIENFEKATRAKAKGRRRLLLVDGHNSHYTLGFLDYARTHRIEVIGYPSHSTHVYQGLDVVIFAPMKKRWSEARDDWERRGHTVDKTNFLAIYAEAHIKTLTPENIKAAFRKTGVIPFNPDVVTTDMMAPSQATSTHATVPIQQSGPIKTMSEMVINYMDYQRMAASSNNSIDTEDLPEPLSTPFFVRSAIDELSSTSAAFLVSSSPIQSTSAPPAFQPSTISPFRSSRYADLLARPVTTAHEQSLHDALIESEARDTTRKECMVGMQAGVVLANIYSSRVQSQLQAREEKKNNKGKKRLMGDGKAKFFSGDDFYAMCVEDERQRAEGEAEAAERKSRRESHVVALAAWKKDCDGIRDRNREKKMKYDAAMVDWEAEKVAAKLEQRRPGWQKPKWKQDYEPEVMPERPKKSVEDNDDEPESDNGDGDDD